MPNSREYYRLHMEGGEIYPTHFWVWTVTSKLFDAENNESKGIHTFHILRYYVFL